MFIFDADGCVFDTLDTIAFHANETLKEFMLQTCDTKYYRKFVGNGTYNMFRRILATLNVNADKKLLDDIMKRYLMLYEEKPAYLTKVFPKMRYVLDELKKREKIALFSNKPDQILKKLVAETFPPGYFDYVLGENERIKRKPDPQGVYLIVNELGEKLSDTIIVGDSETDYELSKNANVTGILDSWGFRDKSFLEQLKPDLLIDDAEILLSIRSV